MKALFRNTFLGLLSFVLFPSINCGVAEVVQFLEEHENAVVLFYRPGCPYCRYVMPLFDAVQKKYEGAAGAPAFLKVDITSDSAALKAAFNFTTVPTFVYVKDGDEKLRHGSNNMKLKQSEIDANIQQLYF